MYCRWTITPLKKLRLAGWKIIIHFPVFTAYRHGSWSRITKRRRYPSRQTQAAERTHSQKTFFLETASVTCIFSNYFSRRKYTLISLPPCLFSSPAIWPELHLILPNPLLTSTASFFPFSFFLKVKGAS